MATQKILVIDDSKVIRRQVRGMLPEADFEIMEAEDGLEGLNLIHQEQPSSIVLDFLMPSLGGWEVYQELQKHPQLQTISLVVMSGCKEEVTDKIQEPFEYFEFLEKPFEAKQLLEAIKAAMVKAKSREQEAVQASQAVLPNNGDQEVEATEIEVLNRKIAKMQSEIDTLKKAMAQLVGFIKQKLG